MNIGIFYLDKFQFVITDLKLYLNKKKYLFNPHTDSQLSRQFVRQIQLFLFYFFRFGTEKIQSFAKFAVKGVRAGVG